MVTLSAMVLESIGVEWPSGSTVTLQGLAIRLEISYMVRV